MGISFGSKSVKPYFGSKEVKEAYVGSQLVYRATQPFVYAFLGAENDYFLAEFAQLKDGANTAKDQNIYRIKFSSTQNKFVMDIKNIDKKILKFTSRISQGGGLNPTVKIETTNFEGDINWKTLNSFTPTTTYQLTISKPIPVTAKYVRIALSGNMTYPLFVDAVRFEDE